MINDRRSRLRAETRSDLATALERLRVLGFSTDEIQQFEAGWDDFTDPTAWSPEIRQAWLRQSDAELLEERSAIRMEYEIGTLTEEESAAVALTAEARSLVDEAAAHITGSIARVLAWVDDDPARAAAALALEESNAGANRKTLIEPLREIAGDVTL